MRHSIHSERRDACVECGPVQADMQFHPDSRRWAHGFVTVPITADAAERLPATVSA